MNTANDKSGEDINVDSWLKSNNLTKLKTLFEDNDLIIEELCEFDNEQLAAFIAEKQDIYKDQRYFDVLTQHRFRKAIKNTRQNMNNKNNFNIPISSVNILNNQQQTNNNNNQRIIVTPEEHEAINKLYNQFDNICKLKESIQQNAFKQLKECSNQLCQTDIESQFNQIINIIIKHKQQLLNNIDAIANNKTKAIHKQLQTIEQYQTEVDSKRAEFENMVYNYGQTNAPFKDINLSQRNQYILKETHKILHSDKAQMGIVTQPALTFSVPTDQMEQFLNEEFRLNSCDQPVVSVFKMIKTGFCFVEVSFNWQSKNINEFEISVGLKKKLTKNKDVTANKKKRKLKAIKMQSKFIENNNSSKKESAFSINLNDNNIQNPFKFGIDDDNMKEKSKKQKNTKSKVVNKNIDIDIKSDDEKEGSLKQTINKSSESLQTVENKQDIKWKSQCYNISKYDDKYKTIYNLKSECEYSIRIRGLNNCGWGYYSKCLSFTTKSQPKSKKMDLEIVECRGYYRRSYNNSMYYHPMHLINQTYNMNSNFGDMEDEEEYMYASDRGYTFRQDENDWIIFKPTKTKNRRYYITQIVVLSMGDQNMPKTIKIEIGDKKSLKLQQAVPDPEINRKKCKARSISRPKVVYTNVFSTFSKKRITRKKKKRKKSIRIKKISKNRNKNPNIKILLEKVKAFESSECSMSTDDENSSSESESETSSDESSDDEKYDKNKKGKDKNKDREWLGMKPKVLETQLGYGRQSFSIKPKVMSDRRCNYIKVSFMTNHNPNQLQKGCKFRLSKLEIWGIAIKD